MGTKRLLAVAACTVGFAGVSASGALAFGPAPPPGNPNGTAQLEACERAVTKQIEATADIYAFMKFNMGITPRVGTN